MANVDNPHGFNFVGMDGPGFPFIQGFAKAVGYGTAIFQGDAVHRVADGSIEAASSNFTPGTTAISGIALDYGALSTATNHSVIVSVNALFEAQDNNDTDGTAAADLGINVNLEANAGSTTTLQSGHELDESTENVSASRDFHMLALLNVPDNAHGSFARIVVKSNIHRYQPGVVGI